MLLKTGTKKMASLNKKPNLFVLAPFLVPLRDHVPLIIFPGTFSESSGTFPEPSGTFPEPSGTFPKLSGTFPEPSGTFPKLSRTFPEPSGTFPETLKSSFFFNKSNNLILKQLNF